MSVYGKPSSADPYARPATAAGAARSILGAVAGHLFALSIAVVGGVLGVVGAVIGELRAGGLILLPILGAPIVEEMLKPVGVYILLARWPRLLRGRLHTALLAAVSGLVFGLIEALAYVHVYVSDPPDWFVTYRFTIPIAFHTMASFIVGLGITQGLLAWAKGESPFPKASRNLYIVAIGLHAVFNTVAVGLALSGVFDV